MTNNMETIPVRVESILQITVALWSDMLGFSGLITSCRIMAAPAFIAELIVLQLQYTYPILVLNMMIAVKKR